MSGIIFGFKFLIQGIKLPKIFIKFFDFYLLTWKNLHNLTFLKIWHKISYVIGYGRLYSK